MRDLKGAFIWVVTAALLVLFLFRVMEAMLVHDNSTILLRSRACPLSAEVDDNHLCRVHGSVSRSFTTSEVVITLDDKSSLWINPKDLVGYSHPDNSVRYEPFGKVGAMCVALFILLVGAWMLAGAPRPGRVSPDR
jgi:hypothetical protein